MVVGTTVHVDLTDVGTSSSVTSIKVMLPTTSVGRDASP